MTEEVWPGARVSRASYVVSMLQPKIVSDLRLGDFGYRAVPLDPAYAALTTDGPIFFFNEPRHGRLDREVLEAGRRGLRGFEDLIDRAASVPAADDAARAPGARLQAPRRSALAAARGRRGPPGSARRDVHDLVRIFTMSVADLLDDWFELDGLKGSIASSGVVGVWAGPRTPGTAYNLLHHALGEIDGIPGGWGQVIGGMGAISTGDRPLGRGAGAEIRTGAEVASIDVRNGGASVSRWPTGPSCERRSSPRARTRRRPSSTSPAPSTSRTRSREDMRRYRTRGGSVKINMVLSEPPRYEGVQPTSSTCSSGRGSTSAPRSTTSSAPGRTRSRATRSRAVRRGRAAVGNRLQPHRRRPLGDDDVHPVRPAGGGGLGGRRPRTLRGRLR